MDRIIARLEPQEEQIAQKEIKQIKTTKLISLNNQINSK
jgi:hypothetical protein